MKLKRLLLFITLIVLLLANVGCDEARVSYVGVNAKILEISKEINGMVVQWLDTDCNVGEKCYINCENEKVQFMFYDYTSDELVFINFQNFMVGDEITVDFILISKNDVLVSRIQLLTQR